jgi:DNA-binding MarR family transcriptional regulator
MTYLNSATQLREIIRILERKLGILGDSQMSCCKITLSQCHALVEIGRAESISLNELAELLNIENSSMSRTVNNLVNRELAIREVNQRDRRYVTIALTDTGKNLYHDIENRMSTYFNHIYKRLPVEKREQILESLELLLTAIEEKECC